MHGIARNRGYANRVLYVKEAPYDAKVGYTRPKRNTIGYVCNDDVTQMHPSTGFKQLFPSLWEKYFQEKVPDVYKHIGMFAMADAVNATTGIKDIMDDSFGKINADAIMDFVLYSMLYHTSVAEHFESRMKYQQLFSNKPYSDSYFSELINSRISYEQILDFKKRRALQCKEDGVEEVWLCIDGSNDDCESKGVILAEKGHAKSHRNINIVSFTYAVTETGKPVTFELYRGGLVDVKAMKRIISFLKEAGIRIRGVILDRGYCDSTAIDYLISESISYVIMVKGDPEGHNYLVDKYGHVIKYNARHLIRDTFLFGVQEKVRLFEKYDHEDYITLFYDYSNGGDRVTAYLKKLYVEMNRLESAISKGKPPVVPSEYKSVLEICPETNEVQMVYSGLQKILDEKGLYSIATFEEMSPQEVHRLYQARGCSETEYMIIKSQLGYGKVRIHATKGVQSKFAIGFIASCIRYELQEAASYVNRTTNEVIQELDQLTMTKIGESYVPVQGITGRQTEILKKLGAEPDLLNQIAKDENNRIAGRLPTPRHRKPGPKVKLKTAKQKHSPKSASSATKSVQSRVKEGPGTPESESVHAHKKRGVKPGTKRNAINKDGSPRKKPGVPVGYKHGELKKDGSPRRKPGPKSKQDQSK